MAATLPLGEPPAGATTRGGFLAMQVVSRWLQRPKLVDGGDILLECARMNFWTLVGAALLAALTAPAAVATAFMYNKSLTLQAEHGVDVREADVEPSGVAFDYLFAPEALAVTLAGSSAAMAAWHLFRAHGCPIPRSFNCFSFLHILSVAASPILRWIIRTTDGSLLYLTLVGFVCVTIWILPRLLARTLGPRQCIFFCVAFFLLWAWLDFWAARVEWVFRDATTDAQRLTARLVVFPLLAELSWYGFRRLYIEAPSAHRRHLALFGGLVLQALQSLLGRVMMLAMRSSEGYTAMVVGVSAVEILLRITFRRRTSAMFACHLPLRNERALLLGLEGHALMLDEFFEFWATMTTAVITLAFRVSLTQSAPDAGEVLRLMALQLLAELGTDLVPWVMLRLRPTMPWREPLLSQLEAFRIWRAPSATMMAMPVIAVGWFLTAFFAPRPAQPLCAWASSDGWWTRAPCGLVERWS